MLTDGIRLLLFPALMAFAASSDLFTMTISNKLSLALTAGFFALTLVVGMAWPAIGMHVAAGAVVLVISFGFFSQGWIGGGDAKTGGRHRAVVRLRQLVRLPWSMRRCSLAP